MLDMGFEPQIKEVLQVGCPAAAGTQLAARGTVPRVAGTPLRVAARLDGWAHLPDSAAGQGAVGRWGSHCCARNALSSNLMATPVSPLHSAFRPGAAVTAPLPTAPTRLSPWGVAGGRGVRASWPTWQRARLGGRPRAARAQWQQAATHPRAHASPTPLHPAAACSRCPPSTRHCSSPPPCPRRSRVCQLRWAGGCCRGPACLRPVHAATPAGLQAQQRRAERTVRLCSLRSS